MKIYAPSYKRPNAAFTHKFISCVQYVVAESEAEEYRKNNLNVWAIPDSAQGNLCRARNYILDNSEDKQIIIIDDDLTGFGRYEKQESKRLNEDEFIEFCEHGFILAEDLGVKFWGVNLLQDKGAYREYTPLSFTAYIGGPFQAFNNLDLRYDEKLPLKEDYDLSLQVLNKYRKTMRFNAYHYLAKQHTNEGGCATYRTISREKQQFELLQKKWGSKIVKKDGSSKEKYDINPIIKIPIAGV